MDRSRRILIFDDEPSVLGFLDAYLQMLDFEPLPTSRWTEAVDLITHQAPDLILLDLRMPTVQGEAVLKFIRERGHTLPVIVVSGYLDAQKMRDLRRMGASGFVPKPFELDELDAAVRKALEMRGPPEPPVRARPAISSDAAVSGRSVPLGRDHAGITATRPDPSLHRQGHHSLGAITDRALQHHRQRRPRRSRDLKFYIAVTFFCLIGSLIVILF